METHIQSKIILTHTCSLLRRKASDKSLGAEMANLYEYALQQETKAREVADTTFKNIAKHLAGADYASLIPAAGPFPPVSFAFVIGYSMCVCVCLHYVFECKCVRLLLYACIVCLHSVVCLCLYMRAYDHVNMPCIRSREHAVHAIT